MGGERLGETGVNELEEPVPSLENYEGKLNILSFILCDIFELY